MYGKRSYPITRRPNAIHIFDSTAKPAVRPLESLGGALSIGEFGSLLRTLFLPETQAEFWKEGEEQFQGTTAIIVGFRVSQERSGWTLSFKKSHSLRVAYQGKSLGRCR